LEEEPQAILLLGAAGRILYANQVARDVLEQLGGELPRHLRDLPPQLQEAILSGAPDGTVPSPRVQEALEGIWAVQLPVRELDPAWLTGMAESEQMAALGQLAATVAREIGGPNTSIQVTVDRLLDTLREGQEEERDALRKILSQTQRIAHLTRQLIALADPGQPRRDPVDVDEVVEAAFGLMESSFSTEEIQLETGLKEAGALAWGDRNHLLQVLVNLLLNARTALHSWTGDRVVRVRAEVNTDRVYVHVDDSGPGIPHQEASRIFLPFVSTTGGTGMGLFLTRQILVEQGGGIRVQPRNEMGGATFTVYLEKVTHE
jgi:C4-dicarboxylate-specific signal transduction histidine kinase